MARAVVIEDRPTIKGDARLQMSRLRCLVFATGDGERGVAGVCESSHDFVALDSLHLAMDFQVVARMLTVTAQQNMTPLLIRTAICPLNIQHVVFADPVNSPHKPLYPHVLPERHRQHADPVHLSMSRCVARWTKS
jgi:hypothetical protein